MHIIMNDPAVTLAMAIGYAENMFSVAARGHIFGQHKTGGIAHTQKTGFKYVWPNGESLHQ
jgi:hypothetical protein